MTSKHRILDISRINTSPKTLTIRIESLRGCRRHWDWLSRHPKAFKWDYFTAVNIETGDIPSSDCYACGYCVSTENPYYPCVEDCVIDWGHNDSCNREGSDYDMWKRATTPDLRTRFAKNIVNRCDRALRELKKLFPHMFKEAR